MLNFVTIFLVLDSWEIISFPPFFGDRGGIRNGIERHKIGHEHFVVCKYGP